jgi:protein-L-isoaspartate(D-aspartate) O-methyltransferase
LNGHHHSRGLGLASDVTRKRLIDDVRKMGVKDEKVLAVLAKLPRHEFIEDALKGRAYDNDALPIGLAQTISQPYIVALMTEAIFRDGAKPKRVLEIGTGSGYQTAVLAELVPQVFTVERLRALSEVARKRLAAMHYQNIAFSYGDGMNGWASHGPYDAIIVTAGASSVPPALIEQLKVGGRLVIPVAAARAQALKLITRTATGTTSQDLGGVTFVPLLAGRA